MLFWVHTLVEFDENCELIRIISWFRKANGTDNASHAIKVINDFSDSEIGASALFFNAIAEFAVAIVKRGLKWKKDTERLREELGPFLKGLVQEHGENFAKAVLIEIEREEKSIKREITSLIPTLPEYEKDTLWTPCRSGVADTILDKTKPKLDQNKNSEENSDGSFVESCVAANGDSSGASDALLRSEGDNTKPQLLGASESARNSALAKGIR